MLWIEMAWNEWRPWNYYKKNTTSCLVTNTELTDEIHVEQFQELQEFSCFQLWFFINQLQTINEQQQISTIFTQWGEN